MTKKFSEFALGCPYCEGNPSAGAVCHYSGEAAFMCRLENCPLVEHRCPLTGKKVNPSIDCLPSFCDVALHGCEPEPILKTLNT